MQTFIKTPQAVFESHQRLVVPLFQRPYVWNEELQWAPLWNDLVRLASQLLSGEPTTHFIGAVVIQDAGKSFGELPGWTIIDGQQRLTTLQLLLDAVRLEVEAANAKSAAKILPLVRNGEAYIEGPEDRFKVWPTNRDRGMFAHLLAGDVAPDGDDGLRLREAHSYFRRVAREWIGEASQDAAERAAAVETALRLHFQMVVIQLDADDDAQEIFETLNARGTPLTAADLVKNFVFSRLEQEGAPIDEAYNRHWRRFETGFWETEISVGRTKTVRSSLFLNHWLVARTGAEVRAREVFQVFKRQTTGQDQRPMFETLASLDRSAQAFEAFSRSAETVESDLDRVALFAYRLSQLDIEAFRPVVLALLDPDHEPVPTDQLHLAVEVLESFLVRRAILRATAQSYVRFAPELCAFVKGRNRERAGEALRDLLASESAEGTYWPGDAQLLERLTSEPLYHRLASKRIRMLLEAVEDDLRGWGERRKPTSAQRVARGVLSIEHVMPRKWRSHWESPGPQGAAERRDQLVHHLGNLTLLTKRLNSRVSNSAWSGTDGARGKRDAIVGQETLLLNQGFAQIEDWSEEQIAIRGEGLAARIAAIWPVPEGHSPVALGRNTQNVSVMSVSVLNLLESGLLAPGQRLHAGPVPQRGRTAIVRGDGAIEVDGEVFETPSGAASYVAGGTRNGWWFWRTEEGTRLDLRRLRRQYADAFSEGILMDAGEELEADDDSDEGDDE